MKKVRLRFSIEVPDDTDPAYVLKVVNEELDSAIDGGKLCQWGDWHPGDAELDGER